MTDGRTVVHERDVTGDPDVRAAQRLLSDSALTVFALNGRFLELAENLARPAGLTAAWWQVIGAVVDGPLPVAGIARNMGITRQSVQRIADLLERRGFVEFRSNPAHRRAKLVALTTAGRSAMAAIGPQHAATAESIRDRLGVDRWSAIVDALHDLATVMDDIPNAAADDSPARVRRAGGAADA